MIIQRNGNNPAVLTRATATDARPNCTKSSTKTSGKHLPGWRSSRTSGLPPWRPAAEPWKSRRTTSADLASVACSAGWCLSPNGKLKSFPRLRDSPPRGESRNLAKAFEPISVLGHQVQINFKTPIYEVIFSHRGIEPAFQDLPSKSRIMQV